jgi:hypothetical protein
MFFPRNASTRRKYSSFFQFAEAMALVFDGPDFVGLAVWLEPRFEHLPLVELHARVVLAVGREEWRAHVLHVRHGMGGPDDAGRFDRIDIVDRPPLPTTRGPTKLRGMPRRSRSAPPT